MSVTPGFYKLSYTYVRGPGGREDVFINPKGEVFMYKNGEIIKSTVFDRKTLIRTIENGHISLERIPTPREFFKALLKKSHPQLVKNPKVKRKTAKKRTKTKKTKRKIRKNCYI